MKQTNVDYSIYNPIRRACRKPTTTCADACEVSTCTDYKPIHYAVKQ